MPYSAASDLRQWHNTSVGQVEANLRKLLAADIVDREKLGWMRDSQWRYFLSDQGVKVMSHFVDWRPRWQVATTGREIIRSYGPMMECLNDAAPQAWSTHTIRAPRWDSRGGWYPDEEGPGYLQRLIRESFPLAFHWLRDGLVDGLIELVNPDGSEFCLPVVWYGTHAPENQWTDSPFQLFESLPTEPDPTTGAQAAPPGVVIVATDILSATRAAREIPPSISSAIITYGTRVANAANKQGRFGIVHIQPMLNPQAPVGKVLIEQL